MADPTEMMILEAGILRSVLSKEQVLNRLLF
jgi:hypothetical protein